MKFARHRLPPCVALIVLALLPGCVVPTQPTADATDTFRVMTYNVHHGEGLDGKVDLKRIADLIRDQRADIVALQEIDKGVQRTARRDFPAELAALTGMTCVFSNNYSFQGGEYGNAVLTRFPVLAATNSHYHMLRAGEQRGLLQLLLNVRGRELLFCDTHVDYRADDAERFANVDEILARLKAYPGQPVILCGDFNDTPESRTCRKLAAHLDDTWARVGAGEGFTIPADQPRKRIDYLWISRDKALAPLTIRVIPSAASDHLPVLAEFRLR